MFGYDSDDDNNNNEDRSVGRGESGAKYKDVGLADTKTYRLAQADDELAALTEAARLALTFARKGDGRLINMATVAVWKHGKTLILASNYVDLRHLDKDQLSEVLIAANARRDDYLGDFQDGKHAEMALVAHMNERGIEKRGQKIGVSKPCCGNCKNALERERIKYLVSHTR